MQTQPSQKRKTRAEAYRERVVIRLASDAAGPAIAEILRANGVVLEAADWAQVAPSFLIATEGDEVIGCIQVMPSRPVGYLNFLYVKPSAGFKMRAIAIRKLLLQGMAAVKLGGAQYVSGFIDVSNEKLANVVSDLGFVGITVGTVVMKRLA